MELPSEAELMELPSEDELVDRWFRKLVTHASVEFGNDCCQLPIPPGCSLVVNVDTINEGVHFFPEDPWDLVARKALRVNVSDLVAKGAEPYAYCLSLALPKKCRAENLDLLVTGLAADQCEFRITLLGGDTTSIFGGLSISVTMFGLVPESEIIPTRNNAQVGDFIYITGTIGDAAVGRHIREHDELLKSHKISEADINHVLDRYLLPKIEKKFAQIVLKYASSSMDVSDGFLLDLHRLCSASKVRAAVELDLLPLSTSVEAILRVLPDLKRTVLTGGDDYEILLTVPENQSAAFRKEAAHVGVSVTHIGRIIAASGGSALVGSFDGLCLMDWLAGVNLGFRHF